MVGPGGLEPLTSSVSRPIYSVPQPLGPPLGTAQTRKMRGTGSLQWIEEWIEIRTLSASHPENRTSKSRVEKPSTSCRHKCNANAATPVVGINVQGTEFSVIWHIRLLGWRGPEPAHLLFIVRPRVLIPQDVEGVEDGFGAAEKADF
jgi:hypothetical protein